MKINYDPDKNLLQIVFDDGKENITVTEEGTLKFRVVNNSHLPTDENLVQFVSLLFLEKKTDYERVKYENIQKRL